MNQTLVFIMSPSNVSKTCIDVEIEDDTFIEENEQFMVLFIEDHSGTVIMEPSNTTITILDDDRK